MAQQCADRETVENVLRGQYGETVQGYGVDSRGTVMHIWGNTQTGTWTVTASTAAGIMCVVGEGQGYVAVNEPLGVDG
jgi:hypothetical protein